MISAEPGRSARDYEAIARTLVNLVGDREARMRSCTDALWDALKHADVSWIGFYLARDDDMVLGACRDKPACSPIGLHGMCGQSYLSREAIVVRDVRTVGEGYIACDPRDLSEVVVPLLDPDAACWGVLDVDSFSVGAFETRDAVALAELMVLAGLSAQSDDPMTVRTL